jgi:hypothetical protein
MHSLDGSEDLYVLDALMDLNLLYRFLNVTFRHVTCIFDHYVILS